MHGYARAGLALIFALASQAATLVTVNQTILNSASSPASGTAVLRLTAPCTDLADGQTSYPSDVAVTFTGGAFTRSLQQTTKCQERPEPMYRVSLTITGDTLARIEYWSVGPAGAVTKYQQVPQSFMSVVSPLVLCEAGICMADSTVTPGVYGSATKSARITIGPKGIITAASEVDIAGGGGGGGITSLGGQTGTSQTFAAVPDSNLGISVSSASNTHTITAAWLGLLPKSRMVSTTVHTDQGNTFTTGVQDFSAATALTAPIAAGAAPTNSARIAYDSTSNTYKVGVNGSTKTLATIDGNVATASAFDHNPSPCPAGQYVSDIDPAGVLTCSTPPGAGIEHSILNYGGAADGTTDNAPAIAAAWAASDVAYFPKCGAYRINSTLPLQPGKSLIGIAPTGDWRGSTLPCVRLIPYGAGVHGLAAQPGAGVELALGTIQNIAIIGTNVSGTADGILLDCTALGSSCEGLRIIHSTVTDFPRRQLGVDGNVFQLQVEGSVFLNPSRAAAGGPLYYGGTNGTVNYRSQVNITNSLFVQSAAALAIHETLATDFVVTGGSVIAKHLGASGIKVNGGVTVVGTHIEGLKRVSDGGGGWLYATGDGLTYSGSNGADITGEAVNGWGRGVVVGDPAAPGQPALNMTLRGNVGNNNVQDVIVLAGGERDGCSVGPLGAPTGAPVIVDNRLALDGNRECMFQVENFLIENIPGSLQLSQISSSAKQGTGSKIQLFGGGSTVTNDCAKFDSNGNVVSTGAPCGTGTGGEANTASNVGAAGVGPFKQKTGVNLEFRNINVGSNRLSATLDTPNNEIDLDVVPANFDLSALGGSLGASQIATASKQGNGTKIQMFGTGTPATNDCAKFDANGNVVSAGAPCGTSGGIASLGGQTGATQTFAAVDDTNIDLTVSSASNVHTVTAAWLGLLSKARMVATTVHTDQGNTFSAGVQDFSGATALVPPISAGAAPTANGRIAYDSTAHLLKAGFNGATKTILTTDGNAATASALDHNPTDCTSGQYANAIDASGNLTCGTPAGGSGVANNSFTLSGTSTTYTHSYGAAELVLNCVDSANRTIEVQSIARTTSTVTVTTKVAAVTGDTCYVNGSGGGGGGGGDTIVADYGILVTTVGSTKHVGIDPAVVSIKLTGSASLDFTSISQSACPELTFTVTGATTGDAVSPIKPGTLEAGLIVDMRVTAADTVTARVCKITSGSVDPANQTFGAVITR